jgi:predicted nucleic acid-binding protein
MSAVPHFVDTNILLRFVTVSDADHVVVRSAIATLVSEGAEICFAPQNIVEFWSVFTRPKERRGGFGRSVREAHVETALIERRFSILSDVPSIHREWRRLVLSYGVSGVQVHDARIVAAMLVHGVTRIVTFNVADFRRYSEITAIHPKDVVPTFPQ